MKICECGYKLKMCKECKDTHHKESFSLECGMCYYNRKSPKTVRRNIHKIRQHFREALP